jgi:hypothetical protein
MVFFDFQKVKPHLALGLYPRRVRRVAAVRPLLAHHGEMERAHEVAERNATLQFGRGQAGKRGQDRHKVAARNRLVVFVSRDKVFFFVLRQNLRHGFFQSLHTAFEAARPRPHGLDRFRPARVKLAPFRVAVRHSVGQRVPLVAVGSQSAPDPLVPVMGLQSQRPERDAPDKNRDAPRQCETRPR